MNALVTGATGFVGSHLVDALVARGATVTALARSASKAQRLPSGIRVEAGDLHDTAALARALTNQDVVFHVAGVVATTRKREFMRVNRDGTRNVAAAAESAGRPRLVLVSSLAAAGPNERNRPRTTADPDRPITAYGHSKLAGEDIVRQSNLRWTILRPPVVYGPRDTEVLRVFRLVGRGVAPLFGDGRQELSAVFAPDLAEALIAAATSDETVGRTYYPCHPETFTSDTFARTVAYALGHNVRVVRLPATLGRCLLTVTGAMGAIFRRPTLLNRDKAAEFLAPAWTADPAPLYDDARWVAATDLRNGLTATAHAYRECGWL